MRTETPKGYRKLAWFTYSGASLSAVWRPSKLHLETPEMDGAICGARPGRHAKLSSTAHDYEDHEKDAGLCSRCWAKAKK